MLTHVLSQSQIYVTTEGQSTILSWRQELVWDSRPILLFLIFVESYGIVEAGRPL
jgi:hypothetical protein